MDENERPRGGIIEELNRRLMSFGEDFDREVEERANDPNWVPPPPLMTEEEASFDWFFKAPWL